MKSQIFVLFIVTSLCSSEKVRYDHYKVVLVNVETIDQLTMVQEIETMGYILSSQPQRTGEFTVIIVPPHKFAEFEEIVINFQLKTQVLTNNLQTDIEKENGLTRLDGNSSFSWTKYNTLDEIYEWLDQLIQTYNVVTGFDVGESYEKRKIRGVKISYKTGNPTIFIEANIHAREWITSATATWLINQLLTSQEPVIRDMAENIDWYFLPVANPDGFAYTHTKDRLWRKTRQPHGRLCRGADPNRNWDSYFGGPGTSKNPCSETYRGSSAFSEPETRALSEFLTTIEKVDIYLSFHSYSQLLMYPYGVLEAGRVSNEKEVRQVGEAMVKKLAQRYGTKYRFGDIATTIYEAAGSSVDWVKSKFDTPLPFVYEFRDTGRFGFILPANQIVPNSEEVLDSLIEMVQQARAIGYLNRVQKSNYTIVNDGLD